MKKRPDIDYPCEWVYKLIGTDRDDLKSAVAEILPEGDYTLTLSNKSSKGKYLCLNLEITVYDHSTREGLYQALNAHADIRLVL